MAKRIVRREWTTQDEKELKRHSKNKTPWHHVQIAVRADGRHATQLLALHIFDFSLCKLAHLALTPNESPP